ncbi:MAG TPA: chemotaxis protein CheX [Thermodesulfobacteriota bacterium]|nr:chemotaxis protein CheX [Deltaproteobacteria bacterium]HNR13630.1 chemotaxis protein CheX [Thermodesulfobacteriota bacterium]HNU72279.1 chemotaxis protein CheX [Thermodesulfobacteriota bacterium]
MKKILLTDCSPDVTQLVATLVGDDEVLESEIFQDGRSLDEFKMIFLELGNDKELDAVKVKRLRYACNFRNVPIILFKHNHDRSPDQTFLMAGSTEVLSLDDPPGACRHLVQGYLAPGRQPLAEEKEYIMPFVENTRLVMKKMAGMEPEFKEVYFCNTFRIVGDVSGIIGLTGEAEGTVVITFYWDLARKVISQMMQVDVAKINAETIHDGVGEIINMISGATKKEFVGKPYHFELSLPTVVMGSGHQIGHPEDSSIAMLIFDMNRSSFALQVCLKPNNAKRPRSGKQ